MRDIKYIVLHCTAGPQTQSVQSILNYWKYSLGWKSPGYHHLIKPNGEIVDLHPIEKPSNGVAGHNAYSIHISYIGGVDRNGKAVDNRTDEQKQAQISLLQKYKARFPNAKIQGHRDFPGVSKNCPSFDVSDWLNCVGL
jgi:N-acetylmuramoyl-L-alanine amidase